MHRLERAFDHLLNFCGLLASLLLLGMMLATVLKVTMRVAVNHGILGIDQISGTMMVYVTFLGAAWVLRSDGHVSVDILTSNLRPALYRKVMIVSSLVGAAVSLGVTYFGALAVKLSLQRGIMVAAELEIPRTINLVIIPLGCFLLGIEFLRRAIRFYRGEIAAPALPHLEL